MEKNNSRKAKIKKWSAYILQGILALLFLSSAIGNIIGVDEAVKAANEIGYENHYLVYLGIYLLLSVILYVYPRTILLGGLLLTGWLGGAVATHVINSDSVLEIIAPIITGLLVWISILLRFPELRVLLVIDKLK